jgi:hypothetical protein
MEALGQFFIYQGPKAFEKSSWTKVYLDRFEYDIVVECEWPVLSKYGVSLALH